MSLAVVATAFGGPENLSLVHVDVPAPGPGEVTVAVRAAGVNPIDWKVYGGRMGADPSRLPMRLGFEAAGVVTAVGPQAVGPGGLVSEGDEVVVYPTGGAYAEQITVPVTSVVPKPSGLLWEQASGLLLAGATAAHLLAATRVGLGDVVLVHGAAGGVGLMAVQLAIATGARVIGTAGTARHELLRSLGAEPVTYGNGLIDRVRALAPDGVDASLIGVGTDEAVEASVGLTKDLTRIATIVSGDASHAAGIKALGGGPGADPGTAIRDAARLDLVRLADAGELRVVMATTFPLAQVAAAHELSIDGHTTGKIALLV